VKTLGVIGGIAPESTVEYYRLLTAGGARSIVINSIDLDRMLSFVYADDMDGLVEHLLPELGRLARAGAGVGLFASNTPHIAFDRIRARSPLPLISIVDCARDEAAARGLKRLAIFGTRFTMRGEFYPNAFRAAGIELVRPHDDELEWIHDRYMGELVKGVFLPETRERLLRIIETMKERDGIDGVVLAGTELPLIVRADSHAGIPLLDTTRIHVSAAIREVLGTA